MLKTRDVVFNLTKANDDDRTIEGVFSTSNVDRTGEPPIDQESWDLKNFKKNPVVLFAHNSQQIAVGKVTKIGLNEKNNLAGKIEFAIDEGVGVYGDLIKTLYNLYKNKFMRAFSVGFMMGEIIVDKKKNTKMVNNELLELSCVPVPANALALAKQKGLDLSALDKETKQEYECECIKCGYKTKTNKHCKDIKCPKCGGEMRRVERPGPGRSADEKPYPNEHACRLKNPKDFEPKSFKRTTRKHDGKEYSIIMGKLKGEKTMTEQAYRYDKETWKENEAKKHCKDHKGTFEAAKKFILYVDKNNTRICIFDGKEKIGEGQILKQFRNLLFSEIKKKKVVTERPTGQKEKSSRKRIQNLNKIIRTLLTEKQKVKSNKEIK